MEKEKTKDVEMEDSEPKTAKAHVNEGFAKHSEKEKIIDTFRRTVWPALAEIGWTKVRRGQ